MTNKNNMIDPADVQKLIDRHSSVDERPEDYKSALECVLRDLRNLLPRDYPEDMLGMWAVHPKLGRVLVCSANPNSDGRVFVTWDVGMECRTDYVDTSTLSFPEQHPETLTTLEDYENAPEGTIVAANECTPLTKVFGGDWRELTYYTIAPRDVTRRVLRWGWGE